MEKEKVTDTEETKLLSVEKLKADNEALTKRVATLEKQVNDMIKELSGNSDVSLNGGTDSDKKQNQSELQKKVEEAFKR